MHQESMSHRLSILYTVQFNELEKDMFEITATTPRVKLVDDAYPEYFCLVVGVAYIPRSWITLILQNIHALSYE